MYHRRNELVYGFHGCDRGLRDELVSSQVQIHKSSNSYDWLGEGMYFWENDYARALDWAEQIKLHPQNGKQSIKEPSVVGAVLCLGQCLDLLDISNLQLLKISYDFLLKQKGIDSIPKNKGNGLIRDLDCAVIQLLMVLQDENNQKKDFYDSVRGVFFEGNLVYPTAGFNERNHIQICVRNPNCIKAYFVPREIDKSFTQV